MTDPSTYKLNHTMLRVKDPQESIKFYNLLGLRLVNKLSPNPSVDLYTLGCDDENDNDNTNNGEKDGSKHWSDRQGLLELTHNHGSESDPSFKIHNGNSEPRGFGHICVSVDNIHAACARLDSEGVKFKKRLEDGRMRNIAFVLDPDGYWVEIIGQRSESDCGGKDSGAATTDLQTYRLNHSMIRIKDPVKSLRFYQHVLGMKLLRRESFKADGFDLYFLGYHPDFPAVDGANDDDDDVEARDERIRKLAQLEGLVELTWNHGTESDPEVRYHNGNDEPKGFGHLSITVDDLDGACARFEDENVEWEERLMDGECKDVATLRDPDGYWVEVLQNEAIKKRANW